MPQIQILPGQPSFGETLGQGLGAGVSQGLSQGLQQFLQSKADFQKNLSKNLETSPRDVDQYLKAYDDSLYSLPDRKNKTLEFYSDFLKKGYAKEEALDLARNKSREFFKLDPVSQEKLGKENLFAWQNLPPLSERIAKQKQESQQMYEMYKGEPKSKLLGFLEGLGNVAESLSGGGLEREFTGKPMVVVPGETEEQAKRRELFKDIGQTAGELGVLEATPLQKALAPILEKLAPIFQKLKPAQKLTETASKIKPKFAPVPPTRGEAAKKIAEKVSSLRPEFSPVSPTRSTKEPKIQGRPIEPGRVRNKAEPETIPKDLQPKISEKVPSSTTPTIERTKRVAEEARPFQTKKEMDIAEAQRNEFSKYQQEIEKDASERAARLEKLTPKTPIGEAGKASRMKAASDQLPKMRNLYESAISRNRALEDAYATATATEKERLKPLLDLSRKELNESQDALRQTISNSKTGGTKKGIAENTEAARKKVLNIQDKIADGEEINLSKADYNPEMVKNAKQLSKKKEPPGSIKDSFYEKVHDDYQKVYQDRLDKIQKELESLRSEKMNMSKAIKAQNLQKEREILKKLVDQTEAEKLIHRRKLALRQMAERKRIENSLKKFKPSKNEKVSQISQEKIFSGKKAQKPSEKSVSIDERIKNITEKEIEKFSKNFPKESFPRGFKEKVEKTTDQFVKTLQQPKNVSSEKEAVKQGAEEAKNFIKKTRDLLSKYPKSSDLVIGIVSGLIKDPVIKDDLNVPAGTMTALAGFVGRGSGWGSGLRVVYNIATTLALQNYRVDKVVDAYKKGDTQKIAEYEKKYGKSYLKKARERLNQ